MKRRRFLLASGAVAAGLATGAVLYRRTSMTAPSLAALVEDLVALQSERLISTGAWSPFKVFAHLAQSIDFSMTGYPQMKSPVFQHTAGRLAFFAFSTAGAMTHDLAAPIPGAPVIPENGQTAESIDRLLASLDNFERYQGTLRPHFAYGELARDDYLAAHVLHVRNHLDEIAAQ